MYRDKNHGVALLVSMIPGAQEPGRERLRPVSDPRYMHAFTDSYWQQCISSWKKQRSKKLNATVKKWNLKKQKSENLKK